jgi:hypothetical protein
MGAAGELVQAMPVKWWAETGTAIRSPALKEWLAELERRREGKQFWRGGEERVLGRDWKVRVLWPPAGGGRGRSEEDGMVLFLEHGSAKLLWAGSIPGEVEKELILQHGGSLVAGVLVQGPAKRGEANLAREWLKAVQPKTIIRWSRALEEDPSLSVDLAEQAQLEGIELVKLEEAGCLTLKPEECGKWKVESWKSREED